jgi:protein gp37
MREPSPENHALGRRIGKANGVGFIDWVIVGGESGPGARVMVPDYAREIRDQCVTAGVPFLFKQWGEWAPINDRDTMQRVGKKRAGRELDGRTWDQYPEAVA